MALAQLERPGSLCLCAKLPRAFVLRVLHDRARAQATVNGLNSWRGIVIKGDLAQTGAWRSDPRLHMDVRAERFRTINKTDPRILVKKDARKDTIQE